MVSPRLSVLLVLALATPSLASRLSAFNLDLVLPGEASGAGNARLCLAAVPRRHPPPVTPQNPAATAPSTCTGHSTVLSWFGGEQSGAVGRQLMQAAGAQPQAEPITNANQAADAIKRDVYADGYPVYNAAKTAVSGCEGAQM